MLAVHGRGLVPADSAVLRVDDLGVARGESVFETVRVTRCRPVLLAEHLERMRASAARVDVDLPPAGVWQDLVATVVARWVDDVDGVLRLTATKGPPAAGRRGEAWAHLSGAPPELARQRTAGVDAVTLTLGVAAGLRADAPWLLGGVKSTSYAVNMAALRAAVAAGAQDAVLVSADGEVLEAPTSTVVWWGGHALVTPPPQEVGTLPGTTATAVLDGARRRGVPVEVRRAPTEELRVATEAALLSSVRGVAPLVALDGRPVGDGAVGPVVARLRDDFEQWCHDG